MPDAAEMHQDYVSIVESNWYSNFGLFENRFRAALVERLGAGVEVATTANATLATLGALVACLGSPRTAHDYVIVPSFTFAAGPQAIRWAGYEPLFIDIDAETLQPDVSAARAALEHHAGQVRGLLLTNSFGIGVPDIDAWEALAQAHQIPLVIDSAAGFGSTYADRSLVGTRGTCEVFSFHATKTLSLGEGGAVASRDPGVIAAVDRFQNFGFDGDRRVLSAGLNAKMSELTAAIGLRQLARFDETLADRRLVAARIAESLTDAGALVVPGVERSAVCFLSVVLQDQERRDRLVDALQLGGVDVRCYYSPVHLEPHFRGCETWTDLSRTVSASRRVVSVPAFESMSTAEIDWIARLARESASSTTECGRLQAPLFQTSDWRA